MKNKKSFVIIMLLAMFAMMFAPATWIGKQVGAITEVQAASVKLSAKKKTIQPKKSFILKLTGTSKNAEWSVPKEYKKIIKIKKKGKNVYRVTGLNSGEGYVQATLGKKTYKCKVTVAGLPSSVTLLTGESEELKFYGGSSVTWSVSKDAGSKAEIFAWGTTAWVTPKKSGTFYLYAAYQGKKYSCKVTVVSKKYAKKAAKKKAKAEYSYDIYLIDYLEKDTYGTDFYTGYRRAVYIKTDNPDPDTIKLTSGGNSVLYTEGYSYDDIKYTGKTSKNNALSSVAGGYIGEVEFSSAGTCAVKLSETVTVDLYENEWEFDVPVKTMTWNVKDGEKAFYAWLDELITNGTNASQTSFEKMQSLVTYLYFESGIRYPYVDSEQYALYLAAGGSGPEFISKRFDSYTSPMLLGVLALRIGGFDKVHNCYGDYAYGTVEWQMYHYSVQLTIGDETKRFSYCPIPEEEDQLDEIQYIDFSNTDLFVKIG